MHILHRRLGTPRVELPTGTAHYRHTAATAAVLEQVDRIMQCGRGGIELALPGVGQCQVAEYQRYSPSIA